MTPNPNIEKEPIINSSFIWKISIIIGALLILTLGIYVGGQYFSASLSKAGHTNDTTKYSITIGSVSLTFPANQIRFSNQRKNGPTKGVNLYLSWPDFEGYKDETAALFNAVDQKSELIFIDIIQADEMADMSGRLEPIYRNFLTSEPQPGPKGLLAYRMDPVSSFKDETLYIEELIKERPFVIKCLTNEASSNNNTTDCQRDITFSNKISVSYRYSENLLIHWQDIEQKIITYIQAAAKQ